MSSARHAVPRHRASTNSKSLKPIAAAIGLAASSVLAVVPLDGSSATTQTYQGTVFYTRYCDNSDNVKKVTFDYDPTAGTLALNGKTRIAATPGADGLVFSPSGSLLVGGQSNHIYQVSTAGATLPSVTTPHDIYHLSLDPSGQRVYGASIPGAPDAVPLPLSGGASGTGVSITGSDVQLDSIAWNPASNSDGWYTSSGPGGDGNIGTIHFTDPTHATTVRKYTDLPASHGMAYDPFTGTVLTFGANHITQFTADSSLTQLGDVAIPGVTLDQGTVDGQGHVYVADNGGRFVFVDYRDTGNVGTASMFASPFLDDCLDDFAPSVGPGSPPADLSLTKVANPSPVDVGSPLTYTLTVNNPTGSLDAQNVVVTDTLPAGVTFVSADASQGTCSQASGVVTCDLGTVTDGASPTVTIVVTPNVAGTITNVADVRSTSNDPNLTDNHASVTTTVNPIADLSITKTATPDPVAVGGTLTYSLAVHNAGPSDASGVKVTDSLASNLTYVSATASQGTCSFASPTVTCTLGTVAANGDATVTITTKPRAANAATSNSASVTSTVADRVPGNNTATVTSRVYSASGWAYGVQAKVSALAHVGPTPYEQQDVPGSNAAQAPTVSLGATVVAKTLNESTTVTNDATVSSVSTVESLDALSSFVKAYAIKASCTATSPTSVSGLTEISSLKFDPGASTLLNLKPAPNTYLHSVNLGSNQILKITLNEQVVNGGTITVNALHIQVFQSGLLSSTLKTDIIVGQAHCSVTG